MIAPATIKPILRYPGAKWRIADWIVRYLPPHQVYVEPFFGSGAVLFRKPRAAVEVANDLDDGVVTFFAVLRDHPEELARRIALTPYARAEYEASDDPADDPIEAARRFVVRVNMAHAGKLGSTSGWRQGWDGPRGDQFGTPAGTWARMPARLIAAAERFRGVLIDRIPATACIERWARREALLYIDPPYLPETLVSGGMRRAGRDPDMDQDWARYYRHTMSSVEHRELLEVLDRHPGPVVLSGYRSALYDESLAHWTRVDCQTRAYRNAVRTESLWLNPVAAVSARQPQLLEVSTP